MEEAESGPNETGATMPNAVQFNEYGGIDVLYVGEVDQPEAGSGEVVVQVKAAGINPGEAAIRAGVFHDRWPARFPSGQGTDFAGVVTQVGTGVELVAVGDEVIGFSDDRSSQADFVVVPQDQVTPKPEGLSWEAAGGLPIVGFTASAVVGAVGLEQGDVVVVAGAAGGVGTLAVQLAVRTGATVVGLASERNHDWLRGHGVVPVGYGDDAEARIREAAGGRVDAFIDLFGSGYVELALGLGIARDRINTIIDFAAAEKHGVKAEGQSSVQSASLLGKLAREVADGELELPVARTFPLAQVQDAYRELEERHTHGKIVLVP